MVTDSDYLVKNAKMVFSHFSELVTKKCLISAHFGQRDNSFLTTIVGLDKKNNILDLDCAPLETLDQQLLTSSKVWFCTELDGIKVSFSGKGIKKIKVGSDWVLSMPIPDAIFWMQRRQYYRVKVPLSHSNSYCRITFKTGDTAETCTFQLNDLSIGGFSFFNPEPKWSEQLQPDCEFFDCTLHLNNGNQADISFVVKNHTQARNNPPSHQDRIGCMFHPLAPSVEASIQRYMQEIELQLKNIGQT